MKQSFIPYGHQSINNNDIKAVVQTLKSDYLTQGPLIEKFEKALAKYVGAKYAVIFNSGTAALHGAYSACGLRMGDEFITSPISFAATANAGLYLASKPIFVDINKDDGNIDDNIIERKITKHTKMIVPVHYGGNPCNLSLIKKIAEKYRLKIIEDACHALGAIYQGKKIGSCQYSDMTVFSFHPVKHITTGEGGAVTTNSLNYYEQLLVFRTHGITKNKKNLINQSEENWYYEMQCLGFNYRMTDFQAALGLSQLKRNGRFIIKRRKIAKIYNRYFKDNPYFDTIIENKNSINAYHLYPILLKDNYKKQRKIIFENLRKNNLGVQVHYLPIYLHPYYKDQGYKKGLCPNAEDFYQKEISIPIYPSMTKRNIEYVIKTVFKVFKNL